MDHAMNGPQDPRRATTVDGVAYVYAGKGKWVRADKQRPVVRRIRPKTTPKPPTEHRQKRRARSAHAGVSCNPSNAARVSREATRELRVAQAIQRQKREL